MQTAVEWLIEQLNQWEDDDPMYRGVQCGIFKQAKEIEEQQKIDFAKHCLDRALDLDIRTAYSNVEQYYTNIQNRQMKEKLSDFGVEGDESIKGYNETYGSKGSDDQVPDVRKMVDVIKWIDEEILLNPHYADSPRLKEGANMVKVKLQSLTSSQTEISDEEIEQKAKDYADSIGNKDGTAIFDYIRGYKDALK